MTKTTLLALFYVMLFVLSCKKESDDRYSRLKQINYRTTAAGIGDKIDVTFDYDAQGRVVSLNTHLIRNVFFNNTQFEQLSTTTVMYNANGRFEKSTYTLNSKPQYFYTYYYNTKGQVTKKLHTKLHASAQAEDHAYTYDNQGRLIADSVYDSFNHVYRYSTYTYDGADNIVVYGGAQRDQWGGGFVLYGEGYAKYDNKRNPHSLLDRNYSTILTAPCSKNNVVEGGSVNGSSKSFYENTYLPNGLLKKSLSQNGPDDIREVSYEYE